MLLEFDATIADFVDVTEREVQRLDGSAPFYLKNRTIGAAIAASVLFLAVDMPKLQLILWVIAGAVFGALTYPRFRTLRHRQQALHRLRAWFGEEETLPVKVETRQYGLWLAQHGVEVQYPWRDIVSVTSAGGDVEIALKYGVVVVRARAFRDDAQRAEFLEEIAAYRAPSPAA